MALGKLLLIPQLVWYGVRAPRDQGKAWDRYWGSIERTGAGGHVLWDAASDQEQRDALERVLPRMDKSLPVVDVGCGNGRFSRLLAPHFPKVVGVDISPNAIARAKEESRGIDNVTFRVLDVSAPGAGRHLSEELGQANAFMRGVLHVFDERQRTAAIANLSDLLGKRGALYCAETNYQGDPLDQLVAQGATPTTMPEPLRKCIEAGIKPPRHFGADQVDAFFARDRWETLERGPLTMHGVPLTAKDGFEAIPSYYAIVRARTSRG